MELLDITCSDRMYFSGVIFFLLLLNVLSTKRQSGNFDETEAMKSNRAIRMIFRLTAQFEQTFDNMRCENLIRISANLLHY